MKNYKFTVFLILMIVSCRQTNKNDSEKMYKSELKEFIKSNKMDKVEFWKIIEYSIAKSNGDNLEQEKVIIEKLSTYNPEQIIEFEMICRQLIIQADNFKIIEHKKLLKVMYLMIVIYIFDVG